MLSIIYLNLPKNRNMENQDLVEVNPFQTSVGVKLIKKLSFEMKFLGMFSIIYGGLVSLTIIGALFGIPMLISGMSLYDSAKKFQSFSKDLSADALFTAILKLRTYFKINFWMLILAIIFTIFYIVFIVTFFNSMKDMFNQTPFFS